MVDPGHQIHKSVQNDDPLLEEEKSQPLTLASEDTLFDEESDPKEN